MTKVSAIAPATCLAPIDFAHVKTVQLQSDERTTLKTSTLPPPRLQSSKPVLAPELSIIESMDRVYEAAGAHVTETVNEMAKEKDRMKELHIEKGKKLEETAKRLEQRDTWSILKKIGSAFMSAVSAVFGGTIIGGAPFIGGALIASGLASIANLIMVETGAWNGIAEKIAKGNIEKEKRLASLIPGIIGTATSVVGLLGSAGAVFWAPLNFKQLVSGIGTSALNLSQAVLTAGTAVAESRSLSAQGDVAFLEREVLIHQTTFEQNAGQIEHLMKNQSEASSRAARIVDSAIQNSEIRG
jgi:hypothetical protein